MCQGSHTHTQPAGVVCCTNGPHSYTLTRWASHTRTISFMQSSELSKRSLHCTLWWRRWGSNPAPRAGRWNSGAQGALWAVNGDEPRGGAGWWLGCWPPGFRTSDCHQGLAVLSLLVLLPFCARGRLEGRVGRAGRASKAKQRVSRPGAWSLRGWDSGAWSPQTGRGGRALLRPCCAHPNWGLHDGSAQLPVRTATVFLQEDMYS